LIVTDEDDTEQVIVDDAEQAIVRAVGEELRRARTSAGWSRPELVKRMKKRVPVNTYACYEQGIRQCSIPRLVEICQVLGVSALELLGLAFQRLELEMEEAMVRIDLRKVVEDDRDELSQLRRWARSRIKEDALTADPSEPAVVRLRWDVVREMGRFCELSPKRLRRYISEFTPESALHT
jgi:transcriptional regulator with XRE-family HTH domain